MNLALVALTWSRDGDPRIPLGHASLLAALYAAAIDTIGLCRAVNEDLDVDDLAAELVACDVDVAIGVYVWNERLVQRLIHSLRRLGLLRRIILGGPQISYAPLGVEALYPGADVFIRGYAEEALVELVRGRTLTGVHFRGRPDLGRTATADLTRIPSPWLSGVVPVEPRADGDAARMRVPLHLLPAPGA